MLRSCICLKKERRDSNNSSTSSCRSSEIERNAAAISNSSDERESRSLMKFLSSSICFKVIRSPRRGLSMTKVERGKRLPIVMIVFKLIYILYQLKFMKSPNRIDFNQMCLAFPNHQFDQIEIFEQTQTEHFRIILIKLKLKFKFHLS